MKDPEQCTTLDELEEVGQVPALYRELTGEARHD